MVRAVGIADVNIDLMYGLPKQTVGDVIRSAEAAASLSPSRIALFGYAHVPWFKPHQKLIDTGSLPGAAERMAQMHAATETLEECGYVAIGLDHFALRGDELARATRAREASWPTSRAIPPTRPTPCWGSVRPRSGGCRKAMCRTRRMSGRTPARSGPGNSLWSRALRSPTTTDDTPRSSSG